MTFPDIQTPAKGINSTGVRLIGTKHDLCVTFDQLLDFNMPDEMETDGVVLEEFFDGNEVDVGDGA